MITQNDSKTQISSETTTVGTNIMMSPGVNFRPFTGVRIVVDTPLSFDEVSRRLKAEMGNGNIPEILALAKTVRTESEFADEVTKRYVGRSGFMLFAEIDHGTWLTVFGIHRRSVRWVLGNPLIAVTMIRHDITVGLFAPVELLITEHEDGRGTNVVYIRPSSLIIVEENEPLRQAAEILDTKLAALVTSATGQIGEVEGSKVPRS
jgi:uncharacterized protein (DUF302 family)